MTRLRLMEVFAGGCGDGGNIHKLKDAPPPATPDLTLSLSSAKIEYLHNPIDILVAPGRCGDFEGIDFGEQTNEVLDISGVGG